MFEVTFKIQYLEKRTLWVFFAEFLLWRMLNCHVLNPCSLFWLKITCELCVLFVFKLQMCVSKNERAKCSLARFCIMCSKISIWILCALFIALVFQCLLVSFNIYLYIFRTMSAGDWWSPWWSWTCHIWGQKRYALCSSSDSWGSACWWHCSS